MRGTVVEPLVTVNANYQFIMAIWFGAVHFVIPIARPNSPNIPTPIIAITIIAMSIAFSFVMRSTHVLLSSEY